eukprot:7848246-Alexandrium_andersonii.AAC.1
MSRGSVAQRNATQAERSASSSQFASRSSSGYARARARAWAGEKLAAFAQLRIRSAFRCLQSHDPPPAVARPSANVKCGSAAGVSRVKETQASLWRAGALRLAFCRWPS